MKKQLRIWITVLLLAALLPCLGVSAAADDANPAVTVYLDELQKGQKLTAGTKVIPSQSSSTTIGAVLYLEGSDVPQFRAYASWPSDKYAQRPITEYSYSLTQDMVVADVCSCMDWFSVYKKTGSGETDNDYSRTPFTLLMMSPENLDDYEQGQDVEVNCTYFDGSSLKSVAVSAQVGVKNEMKAIKNYKCTINGVTYGLPSSLIDNPTRSISLVPRSHVAVLSTNLNMFDAPSGTIYYPDYDEADETETVQTDPEATAYRVLCRTLNVRSTPSTKLPRIGRIHRGDEVQVLEISNGWAKIEYNDGIAYVCARYITVD